jgi:hypothetical protein
MHILAILFVLLALAFAFGVIGGMLFAYRERIGEALTGYVVAPVQRQERLVRTTSRTSRTSVKPRAAISPIPLAA